MKNKEDFLDEALKVVVRDSADDFFYIDDDGIIQSEYTIEEIRDMVREEQNELYEQDKRSSIFTNLMFIPSCTNLYPTGTSISIFLSPLIPFSFFFIVEL
jgi:5'(3')-deoxyribonucleotidase